MDQAVPQAMAAMPTLSPIGLFMHASLTVKMVMILLLASSIMVWAIVAQKIVALRRAKSDAAAFESKFWSGGSLEDLYEQEGARPSHPMAAVFGAAMGEWRRSSKIVSKHGLSAGTQDRIDRAIELTVSREGDRLKKHMAFLATVGPVGPFVGLFGTVWGIMTSFGAIASMKSTSLSVVAPGISEALFATAMGLVTAIPAYVAYNMFSNEIENFLDRLEGFGGEFVALLSRQAEDR